MITRVELKPTLQIYPTFSPSQSVKNYSYGPPVYAQHQPGYPGAPPMQAGFGPTGGVHQISAMGGSFRAVSTEKVVEEKE